MGPAIHLRTPHAQLPAHVQYLLMWNEFITLINK